MIDNRSEWITRLKRFVDRLTAYAADLLRCQDGPAVLLKELPLRSVFACTRILLLHAIGGGAKKGHPVFQSKTPSKGEMTVPAL